MSYFTKINNLIFPIKLKYFISVNLIKTQPSLLSSSNQLFFLSLQIKAEVPRESEQARDLLPLISVSVTGQWCHDRSLPPSPEEKPSIDRSCDIDRTF